MLERKYMPVRSFLLATYTAKKIMAPRSVQKYILNHVISYNISGSRILYREIPKDVSLLPIVAYILK